MHLVQASKKRHTATTDRVRSVVAGHGDLVDELLSLINDRISNSTNGGNVSTHVRAMHTRATIHVAQNLGATDTNAVNARDNSVMNLSELKASYRNRSIRARASRNTDYSPDMYVVRPAE